MGLKRMVLLGVGIAALFALWAPTYASAAEWLYEGNPIEEESDETLHKSGTVTWTTSLGSMSCQDHYTLTVKSNGKAEVTQVNITTKTCAGTGFYEGCKMVSDQPTDLPWQTDNLTPQGFTITDFTIDPIYNCSEEETEVLIEIPEVNVVPDNSSAITSFELAGEGTETIFGVELSVNLEGLMEVDEESSGKFGIE